MLSVNWSPHYPVTNNEIFVNYLLLVQSLTVIQTTLQYIAVLGYSDIANCIFKMSFKSEVYRMRVNKLTTCSRQDNNWK